MNNPITDFYKATIGPELAGLIEKAMDKERDRIIQIIESLEPSDCCWQYHSGHLAKSDIIKTIQESN
jgi:hypothetical protein